MMKAIRFFVCLFAAAVLSACTGLPRAGEVVTVRRGGQLSGGIALNPKGPTPGASAQEVVHSFLRAASVGLTDDFATARQFLTKQASQEWNPLASVGIYPDSQSQTASQTPTGAFRVSVSALAALDREGKLSSADSGATLSQEFSLIRDGKGEWRIGALSDGIAMPKALFDSLYRRTPLYFPTFNDKYLLPEVRWFPRQGGIVNLAKALVKGPGENFSGVARSAVPENTEVLNADVDGKTGRAKINLSAGAASLSDSEIGVLKAQFAYSVAEAGLAQSVELTVNGTVLGGEAPEGLSSYADPGGDPVVLRDGVPVKITQNGKGKTLFPEESVKPLQLTDLALGYGDPPLGAGVGQGGTQLSLLDFAKKKVTSVASGDHILTPSFDRAGWMWWSESKTEGKINLFNPSSGSRTVLNLPQIGDGTAQGLKVSREGSRLVAAVRKDDGLYCYLVGILRDGSGRPTGFSKPVRIAQAVTEMKDMVWIGDTRLVFLAKADNDTGFGLYEEEVGGFLNPLPAVGNPLRVAGGKGKDSLVVLNSSSDLFGYSSGVWRKFASGVTSPAFPG